MIPEFHILKISGGQYFAELRAGGELLGEVDVATSIAEAIQHLARTDWGDIKAVEIHYGGASVGMYLKGELAESAESISDRLVMLSGHLR